MASGLDLLAPVMPRLLKIEDNLITSTGRSCVVDVVVLGVGAWHVKFRDHGVIVNRRDLVLPNCVVTDASLTCHTFEAFVELSSLKASMADLQGRGLLEVEQRDPEFTTGIDKMFKTLNVRDESSLLSPKKVRPSTSSMNHDKKPLKMGWCYKKRDIIMGWRCRFFKIYHGQVEYFRDEGDLIPRGVIPILGAEIKGPSKCTVNGAHECFSISIEPRHKDKVFKLASIKSGNEGMEDVVSWINALVTAAKPTEVTTTGENLIGLNIDSPDSTGMVTNDMGSPRVRPRSLSSASQGNNSAFNNPPPLIPKGSTRIKRSILGAVVAAVQRRGYGSSNSSSSLSWISAPSATNNQQAVTMASSKSNENREMRNIRSSTNIDEGAISLPDEVQPVSGTARILSFFEGDGLYRVEILIASFAVIIFGGLNSGIYGVIAAAFLCVLTIIIAFVPLAIE